MKKIKTLFVRDPQDMRHVTSIVTPGCEWVLIGRGVATRKYDGTCVMFDGDRWWARREVKPGKKVPAGFVPLERDATTGKTVGWEPVEQSGFAKFHAEAMDNVPINASAGTYELVGPKINGNPERFEVHELIRHEDAEVLTDVPRDYDGLAEYLSTFDGEGIVWHCVDGRMAKIKRRDFR